MGGAFERSNGWTERVEGRSEVRGYAERGGTMASESLMTRMTRMQSDIRVMRDADVCASCRGPFGRAHTGGWVGTRARGAGAPVWHGHQHGRARVGPGRAGPD